jgi:hypothetical protein
MKAPQNNEPVAVSKAHDFTLWMMPKVENFPRAHRFTIGERLTALTLDLLTSLVEAAYARDKRPPLDAAATQINKIRYLLRLARDLRLMSADSWAFSAERLDEIGRMAGGWKRSLSPA